jgi:hypothetical protein
MTIKKYTANKDNTITNAYQDNLSIRATGSNMGSSDIVEVFSIYGQATSSSAEQARILVEFPISQIVADRAAAAVPASGSVSFVLKLTNAEHSFTTPSSFTLNVGAISNSWSEGTGLDMEGYTDAGASNWVSRSLGLTWGASGGDVLSGQYLKDVVFDSGLENLEVDISNIVEDWIDGTIANYGLLIKLSGSAENVIGGADPIAEKSYYTKRFFARQSQFFFARPNIEARWDDSISDDRNNILKSSSLAPKDDNISSIYLYNKIRGVLRDIPNTGSSLVVQLYTSSVGNGQTLGQPQGLVHAGGVGGVSDTKPMFISASREDTGVYRAQFCYSGSHTTLFDVWSKSANGAPTTMLTGSGFTIHQDTNDTAYESSGVVLNITNLKPSYTKDEKATLKVYTRDRNKTPTLYTIASKAAPVTNVREAYYKISRVADNLTIVPYSTGSGPSFSKLSYGVSGSYFNFDMSILESNYLYEISILRKQNQEYVEQKEKFRFRVD